MEPTPTYEQAIDAFKKFLAREGWSQVIVWRRPNDIVRRAGKPMVVRRRSARDSNAWAQSHYDMGRAQGLGIALSAECEIDGSVCATVFWTADTREAELRMMPDHGLKLAAVLPRTSGKSVSWLEWWLATKREELRHKAFRAQGARIRNP